jgi:hypothetical protein
MQKAPSNERHPNEGTAWTSVMPPCRSLRLVLGALHHASAELPQPGQLRRGRKADFLEAVFQENAISIKKVRFGRKKVEKMVAWTLR